jgi:DNA-binding transcriptional ArsR family regulator
VTQEEEAILRAAHKRYPVTVEELRETLNMRPAAFDLALRSLMRKGLVALEPLEDCTYIRPLVMVESPPPPPELKGDDISYM